MAIFIAVLVAMLLTGLLSVLIVWLMLGASASWANLLSFEVSILTIPFFLLTFVFIFFFTERYYTSRFIRDELVLPLKELAQQIHNLRLDGEASLTVPRQAVLEVDEIYHALKGHVDQFQSVYDKFDALMITDHKTGLLRRNHMDACIRQEVFLAERYQRPFSITLVHLTQAKMPGKTEDEALVFFTAHLREGTRKADSVFYINDKLFVIVSPETDAPGASALSRSLVERFEQHDSLATQHFKYALAHATYGEDDGLNYKDLIATAKKRLQKALKI
ncbi:diguanylate cyclase [Thiomicrospira microaerophila]|uniref:GGDEF domain-containing protein n=1 Tax=Thiomicrospira microaerophila TaxID=406020 RepID=UPI00200D3EB9|nr:diguanylate cyclase [Thiomicrospira microaerophila]UQB41335.1 diguanylate cyclase [Thiomicrospira microaerophila]